jgi:hypothetical protein
MFGRAFVALAGYDGIALVGAPLRAKTRICKNRGEVDEKW